VKLPATLGSDSALDVLASHSPGVLWGGVFGFLAVLPLPWRQGVGHVPSGAPTKQARDGGRTASAGEAHNHPNYPAAATAQAYLRTVTHSRLYSKHTCVPTQGKRPVTDDCQAQAAGAGGLDRLSPLCRKAPGIQEPTGKA